ncbi:MAG: restriction endonuclease [Planctomycetes bacterium]|nr:restriction endonuclease [Planctomycetota bacterium]
MPTVSDKRIREAVRRFWRTRSAQSRKQKSAGSSDQGKRSAVTGGAQMDGFVDLFVDVLIESKVPTSAIYRTDCLELPGFFRPTKEWDLLVVLGGRLVLGLEAKSQVGPSFGNNFNNRTEEAMGSALDLWTAYRKNAFGASQPWLGYMMLLEACDASNRPVKVREPHFEVFPEFKKASYAVRYEEFCKRLLLERHYSAAALLLSREGNDGEYSEPNAELTLNAFAKSMAAHVSQFVQ